jgi:hypothetical protein
MKSLQVLLSVILLLPFATRAETASITLQLCDVELATDLRSTTTEKELFSRKFGKIESYSTHDELVNHNKGNELINALHYAFSDHRPIEITPDHIWMLIAQGFSYHVAENSEQLRSKFVGHAEKEMIEVRNDRLKKGDSDSPWEETFPLFYKEIEKRVGEKVSKLIGDGFSTTTKSEEIAFQITLMDSMKTYFDYSVSTFCGIPAVTLKGTAGDWVEVKARTEQLREYDLDWWVDEIIPILNEFIYTAEGSKSVYFWNSMYKYESASGGPRVTGWITKFFPYAYGFKDGKHNVICKNEGINHAWGMELSDFPPGMSKTPFTWNYYDKEYDMEFLAGFVGVKQDIRIPRWLGGSILFSTNFQTQNIKRRISI